MRFLPSIRRVYFFGYGADCEPDMIRAVTGRKPRVIGPAILDGYQLRIQSLQEITEAGANPRRILGNGWGPNFRSYVIVPHEGSSVRGTLFKISLHDRHLVDDWELVNEGWYDKCFMSVRLEASNKTYNAETQVLRPGQNAKVVADGLHYASWLQPKSQFMRIAQDFRLSN